VIPAVSSSNGSPDGKEFLKGSEQPLIEEIHKDAPESAYGPEARLLRGDAPVATSRSPALFRTSTIEIESSS
jgi:hypothetical protein